MELDTWAGSNLDSLVEWADDGCFEEKIQQELMNDLRTKELNYQNDNYQMSNMDSSSEVNSDDFFFTPGQDRHRSDNANNAKLSKAIKHDHCYSLEPSVETESPQILKFNNQCTKEKAFVQSVKAIPKTNDPRIKPSVVILQDFLKYPHANIVPCTWILKPSSETNHGTVSVFAEKSMDQQIADGNGSQHLPSKKDRPVIADDSFIGRKMHINESAFSLAEYIDPPRVKVSPTPEEDEVSRRNRLKEERHGRYIAGKWKKGIEVITID